MKKVKQFTKNETRWDTFYYYEIFANDGVKMLSITAKNSRVDRGKSYLSWVIREYPDCIPRPLDSILEWDLWYGINGMMDSPYEIEYEPYDCFKIANELMTSHDPEGRCRLDMCDIKKSTPCGSYFGW